MVETMLLQRVLKRLERYLVQKNNFSLTGENYDVVLAVPSDKFSPYARYSLVISARLLNDLNQKDVIKEVFTDLKGILSFEEYNSISRLNVLHTEDSLVKSLKSVFGFRQEVFEINDMAIAGVKIDSAYLLKSLVLDKLIKDHALTLEVKNEIGTVDRINAGIIRMDQNFEVVHYTGKGLREIWKPDAAEKAKAEALRKKTESFLLENDYISKTKLDDIIKVL